MSLHWCRQNAYDWALFFADQGQIRDKSLPIKKECAQPIVEQ